MEKKTQIVILIVVILLVIAGVGVVVSKKIKQAPQSVAPVQVVDQPTVKPTEQVQTTPQDQTDKSITITGKVHSMNAKQIYLDLADGKGSATDISAATPVKTQGSDKIGNLSNLKIGDSVSIKVGADNSAQEISIIK